MDTLDRDVTGVDGARERERERERGQERGRTSVNPGTFREQDAASNASRPPRENGECRGTNIPFDTWEEDADNGKVWGKVPLLCPGNNKVPGAEGIRDIGR